LAVLEVEIRQGVFEFAADMIIEKLNEDAFDGVLRFYIMDIT
jgi:hypothetical protein